MWVPVAQKVHFDSCTIKVKGGTMYRDTCKYITLSAQILEATFSRWGIWRNQDFVGYLGWRPLYFWGIYGIFPY